MLSYKNHQNQVNMYPEGGFHAVVHDRQAPTPPRNGMPRHVRCTHHSLTYYCTSLLMLRIRSTDGSRVELGMLEKGHGKGQFIDAYPYIYV